MGDCITRCISFSFVHGHNIIHNTQISLSHPAKFADSAKKMLLVYHIQVHCMLIVDSVKTQFIINVNNNYVGNTHLTDIRFM